MNKKLKQLAERRERLIEKAANQRMTFSKGMAPLRTALGRVDQGIAVLRYLKKHPAWFAGGATFLIYVIGPGRILKWLGRGLAAWRTMYQFRLR